MYVMYKNELSSMENTTHAKVHRYKVCKEPKRWRKIGWNQEKSRKMKDKMNRIATQDLPSSHTDNFHRGDILLSAIASRYGSCLPFNPISNL